MGDGGNALLNVLTLGLVGGGKTRAPDPIVMTGPAPGSVEMDAAAKAAALEQAELERKKKGRAATIMTGAQGVTDEAPIAKKRLFGE